ncbi:L-rhamnonate dehydratase [Comamonas sp. JC664]|uniref:L-rhamnonate dehydratase n=1 Tax=Comamonas sp. JC664 TaxID=2801917 RepID=UPI0036063C95
MSQIPTIKQVRAYTLKGGGADYHDQADGHWIDDHIATANGQVPRVPPEPPQLWHQCAGHPGGRDRGQRRQCRLCRHHRAASPQPISSRSTWHAFWKAQGHRHRAHLDQMYWSTLYYGRKGIVINTISGVDLALWDLLGKVRGEPVHQLLGGAVRDELQFYATGARPDLAQKMGFIGGKMPLHYGPAEGEEGLRRNLEELATMRERVGPDFWLMLDCWMSLDLNYATRLAQGAQAHGLNGLKRHCRPMTTGAMRPSRRTCPPHAGDHREHEATRWGFRQLLEMGCCDIIQPDVGWCGGITELLKISALADAHQALVIPHGSSVYSYHFVATRHNSPFAEFLMMAPRPTRLCRCSTRSCWASRCLCKAACACRHWTSPALVWS